MKVLGVATICTEKLKDRASFPSKLLSKTEAYCGIISRDVTLQCPKLALIVDFAASFKKPSNQPDLKAEC